LNPRPLACHRGIPATAPTTKPCVASHCNDAVGPPGGGSCGLMRFSCCAVAARETTSHRDPGPDTAADHAGWDGHLAGRGHLASWTTSQSGVCIPGLPIVSRRLGVVSEGARGILPASLRALEPAVALFGSGVELGRPVQRAQAGDEAVFAAAVDHEPLIRPPDSRRAGRTRRPS
jgi:hypothetical protein